MLNGIIRKLTDRYDLGSNFVDCSSAEMSIALHFVYVRCNGKCHVLPFPIRKQKVRLGLVNRRFQAIIRRCDLPLKIKVIRFPGEIQGLLHRQFLVQRIVRRDHLDLARMQFGHHLNDMQAHWFVGWREGQTVTRHQSNIPDTWPACGQCIGINRLIIVGHIGYGVDFHICSETSISSSIFVIIGGQICAWFRIVMHKQFDFSFKAIDSLLPFSVIFGVGTGTKTF